MKFDRLIYRARDVIPLIDDRSRSKHVSFLLDGKKIVSCGYNQPWRTHPLGSLSQARFDCLHSEAHAITRCRRRVDKLDRLTLVNIRFRRNGTLALSKPCCFCQKLLSMFNITDVWYTNNEGRFEKYDAKS